MIPPATGDYERDRQRHVQWVAAEVAAEMPRVGESLEVLWKRRDERLRELVVHARQHSRFWADRLAHIDVSQLDGHDLSMIPPLTKAELMENWDEIVCDPRLDLARAEQHLDRVGREGPAYLLDEYHVFATGGSTGRRAVVVWDFEGWGRAFAALQSRGFYLASLADKTPELPIRSASLMSVNPVHMGGALAACFSNPAVLQMHRLSTATPLPELVRQLGEIRPRMLSGYPSMLHELALEKLRGNLDLELLSLQVGGEPMLPEARECIERAFGAPVTNMWGASEVGFMASNCPGAEGLVLHESACVVEPVDLEGRPVPVGKRAAKVLVTNLLNRVLPVLRYEITDEVTLLDPLPDGPLHGRRVGEIQGRLDEAFRYADGVFVHPHLFRSALTQLPDVAENQVVQTPGGARVALVSRDEVDLAGLARRLERELERAGLRGARVVADRVDRLGRHVHSGKLKRFVPLAPQPGGPTTTAASAGP